jgi:hypothetical protein
LFEYGRESLIMPGAAGGKRGEKEAKKARTNGGQKILEAM